ARPKRLHAAVDGLILRPGAFGLIGPAVGEERSADVVRSALGHDVDDAAGGLAELGFVAAGLDLDFLDEVERRRVAERSEHDRVGAEGAVALIGDVHAVDDVLVLEAAAAGNRRVLLAGAAARADAGRQVADVA